MFILPPFPPEICLARQCRFMKKNEIIKIYIYWFKCTLFDSGFSVILIREAGSHSSGMCGEEDAYWRFPRTAD